MGFYSLFIYKSFGIQLLYWDIDADWTIFQQEPNNKKYQKHTVSHVITNHFIGIKSNDRIVTTYNTVHIYM